MYADVMGPASTPAAEKINSQGFRYAIARNPITKKIV
jgi:hypothetical protein